MNLELYRRHSGTCPHAKKGIGFTKCRCPIWCYGNKEGREIRRSMKLRDWNRAVDRLAKWEKAGKEVPAITLEQAVKAYLSDCKARNLTDTTLKSYAKTLEHFRGFCGPIGVSDVDLEMLTNFRTSRRIAATTSRKELETLRAFSAFALDRGWMDANAAKKLRAPRETQPPTMPFTDTEISAIIAACDRLSHGNPEMEGVTRAAARARCLVMLYSGMRISDTIKLERTAVNMKTGALFLRMAKTGQPLYVKLEKPALDALRALPSEGRYFFWTGKSKVATVVGNARRSIQRVLKIAGVKGHPHRFRDTFSVALLLGGADLRTVQMLLGHSSIRTTEKHYAPFVAGFQRVLDDATKKLDFGKKSRTKNRTDEGNVR